MDLSEILTDFRRQIIETWVDRLHGAVSEKYSRRPVAELFSTVAAANDAIHTALVHGDRSRVDAHIEWITNIRLEGGFSLSEVQHAYDLYRTVLVPILLHQLEGEDLRDALERTNDCLLYTIKKFSNYYQSLHEKEIREHAQGLEREVEKRTRELGESESKYRVLVEEINDGYFVNQAGHIVFANQAFCDLHGYEPNEIVGKAYTEIVAAKSLPTVQRLYEKRMTGEDTDDLYVYLRRHKNGDVLPTENKVKRILYRGEFAVAGICRDITERMETEKRIRESERLAHIGKLTTSLAHEIRNPLSSVKMNSQIILKNAALDGNNKRRMEIIVHEISRLERILDEMLDFARPLRLNLRSLSINTVMDACLDVMDERIREKGITVKKRYTGTVPETGLDQEKIEQGFINVLLNAIDALTEGGNIEVATGRTRGRPAALRIDITDDGPGISKEDLPYVFDPFFSNKKKGTGLGLSNVKRIIEAHGGTGTITNVKPHGTRVSLTIPLKEAT
ncbi:MAG TPA: ATP-binding protein [Syntrophorhabdaceae bacterium]|jgi:PAS domain S-box-containing protein